MSNFSLRPIRKTIQDKLNRKSRLLRRENPESPNQPISDNSTLSELYTRTTWAQMISLTVVGEKNNPSSGKIAVLGAGGEVNMESGEPIMKSGFDQVYGGHETLNNRDFYKPTSGIKNVSISYEGNVKSLRKATVSFMVSGLDDLERLTPHFFTVGAEVLLEFGWSTYPKGLTLGDELVKNVKELGIMGMRDQSLLWNKKNLAEQYENRILAGEGDYDFALGTISNFNYSMTAGGFNAEVTILTTGVSILDTVVPRDGHGKPSTLTLQNDSGESMDLPAPNFYKTIQNLPETLFYALLGQEPPTFEYQDGEELVSIENPWGNTTIFKEEKDGSGKQTDESADISKDKKMGSEAGESALMLGSLAAGAKLGMMSGAAVGSIVPFAGTTVGAVVGTVVGVGIVLGAWMETGGEYTIFEQHSSDGVIQIFTGFNWTDNIGTYQEKKQVMKTTNFQSFSSEVGRRTVDEQTGKVTEAASSEGMWEKTWDTTKDIVSKVTFGAVGSTDSILDHINGQPEVWVRWGWFEDNILTRLLGYGSNDEVAVYFRSIEPKIDNKGNIIPEEFESTKFTLPKQLITTNCNSVLIPDRTPGLELAKVSDITDDDQGFNLYGNLGNFLKMNLSQVGEDTPVIPKVEVDGYNEKTNPYGYFRNLYFNAYVLKDAFAGISTVREGMNNLFSVMADDFGSIFSFDAVSNIYDAGVENRIGIIDKNAISDHSVFNDNNPEAPQDPEAPKGDFNRVYEFPVHDPGSFVKTQDLKVSIPNSMAVTALYGTNQPKGKLGQSDPNLGGMQAQKLTDFFKIDENGDEKKEVGLERITILPYANVAAGKLFTSKDSEEKPRLQASQVNFLDSLNSVVERGIHQDSDDSISPTTYPIGTPPLAGSFRPGGDLNSSEEGNYLGNKYNAINGSLKTTPLLYKNKMLYDIMHNPKTSVQNNFSSYNGLMDLSITIDGTGGIFPGDAFHSKYLPKAFQKRVNGEWPIVYQAIEIGHEIATDSWTTSIKGMPRFNPKAFNNVELSGSSNFENPPESQTEHYPNTYGLTQYYNFFNMRADFAMTMWKQLWGINVGLQGYTGSDYEGSIGRLGKKDVDANGEIISAIFVDTKGAPILKHLKTFDYSSAIGGNALLADFSKVFDELPEKWVIPKKKIWNPKKTKEEVGFTITNKFDMLYYLQVVLLFVGQYYSQKGKISDMEKFAYEGIVADTWFKNNRNEALWVNGVCSPTNKKEVIREGINWDSWKYYKYIGSHNNGKGLEFQNTDDEPWNQYGKGDQSNWGNTGSKDGNGMKPPVGLRWLGWKKNDLLKGKVVPTLLLYNELFKSNPSYATEYLTENSHRRLQSLVRGGIKDLKGEDKKKFDPIQVMKNLSNSEFLIKLPTG